jgi:hypothetical protein
MDELALSTRGMSDKICEYLDGLSESLPRAKLTPHLVRKFAASIDAIEEANKRLLDVLYCL